MIWLVAPDFCADGHNFAIGLVQYAYAFTTTVNDTKTASQYREWTVGLNWNLDVNACRITHLITIMAASQLHFLANKNAEMAGRSQ